VEQGPAPNIADNTFSEVQISDRRFRGFTANAETFAIDGNSPSDMSGPLRKVLGRAAPRKYGESGKWINHVERSGNLLLAWIHDETGDAPGQGLKTMSLAKSKEDGLHWQDVG